MRGLYALWAVVGLAMSSSAQQLKTGTTSIATQDRSLELRLDCGKGCALRSVKVRGREVLDPTLGAATGVCVADRWASSRSGNGVSSVSVSRGKVVVTGVAYGGVEETWTFTPKRNAIEWRIDRRTATPASLDDTAQPEFTFGSMSTWTGALLGTGGVAWCKLFDTPGATYGVHTDSVVLWNKESDACLELGAKVSSGHVAARFTREATGAFTVAFAAVRERLKPRKGQARYDRNDTLIWAPFATSGKQSLTLTLRARSYCEAYDRGELKGVDGDAVREIMNTIGRIGVIDEGIMGSNGWYSGYAVLHEPWIAQMGLAVDDPAYTSNMSRTLDHQRDLAIDSDGMVKSRWAYGPWDAKPGTYDANGFYECQWGRLMDTQPSYVINVAEQFDLTGDLEWVRRHKRSCEDALMYLLNRDTNRNGLVEMATDSMAQRKASDWLDVIWASYENAFVNAQMYRALTLWSEIEELLGDFVVSADCKLRAAKLKQSFNKPTAEGGFWDPDKRWYAYWRERDGSIRGNNLTLPVNFMAIAYGICDDPDRHKAILDQVESAMKKESLFCWPANIYTFLPGETDRSDFPNYENGDIFLAWAEVGIRAYARYDPAIAMKYVRNVLDRYAKDGLAFQRYLRKDQSGAGDDILANNCSAVVGLYRDVYGIQPRYNRLYLEPHMTPELNGTVLKYRLRGQNLEVSLSVGKYAVGCDGWRLECDHPFGSSFSKGVVTFFDGDEGQPSLSVQAAAPLLVHVQRWQHDRQWSVESVKGGPVSISLYGLRPQSAYPVVVNGRTLSLKADANGRASLAARLSKGKAASFRMP